MSSSPATADRGAAAPHPLLAAIAARAAAAPDAVALLAGGESLGYAALWDAAGAVAAALRAAGLSAGDRVALAGMRGPRSFVNLLGILRAGGIYVPLGEKAPPARQAQILADAGARFRLDEGDDRIVPLDPDAAGAAIAGGPAGYILYTSGSTGAPKGVQVTLDNVAAYVANLAAFYPPAAGARIAQIADLGFDASVHEIFRAWTAGATLCVVPTRAVLMWPRYFRDLGIAEALLVPSQVRLADEARLLRDGALPALDRLFLGAELVTGFVARRLRAAAPAAALVNLWGPTEGTVALTHQPIDALPADHEGVPIGRPWPDHRILLDPGPASGAVESGAESSGDADFGEMLVAGPQLCRGYWRLPVADAERFLIRDGVRCYRSGDLARRDAAGRLSFAGRRDRQVKIKGNRIELDECERAIRRLAGTDQAFVLVDGDGLACLIRAGIALDRLDADLRAELPAYMVPARYLPVADFPLAASGKVDLGKLRALVAAG